MHSRASGCSPARPAARLVRAFVVGALGVALALGPTSAAAGDPLVDRHAQLQHDVDAALHQLDQHTAELDGAVAAHEASRRQLEAARGVLEATRRDLADARAADAELAAKLAHEQELLRAAKAATAAARSKVVQQRDLIARAARDAYQHQSDLAGLVVILGGRSPAEIGQRLQWDTTIFNTTAKRLEELKELEARLEAAEAEQATIEARVAADKLRSADNVARVARLEADALAQELDVAALVARNEQLQAAAQAAVDADTAQFQALMAEEASVQAELAQHVARQLAGGTSRDDIERLVRMGLVSRNHSTYELHDSGPQIVLSPRGFIRPVKARPGSPFGQRFHPILKVWRMHSGTDWGAACGLPVYAAQSGTVVKAGPQGGFGNYTIIDHGVIGGRSVMTGYAHQSSMSVRAGQRVEMGQLIGHVGTTGLSTGCHLHLQVYVNGKPVDPLTYIP